MLEVKCILVPVINHHTMNYRTTDLKLYPFLTSALGGSERSVSCFGRFACLTWEIAPGTHWIGEGIESQS